MKLYLQCAKQQLPRSNFTKFCAGHAERFTYSTTSPYQTSWTVPGATRPAAKSENFTKYCACHEQLLRLPRQVTLELHHVLGLPQTGLAWGILITYETSFTVREATGLRPNITKYAACHGKTHSQKFTPPVLPVQHTSPAAPSYKELLHYDKDLTYPHSMLDHFASTELSVSGSLHPD